MPRLVQKGGCRLESFLDGTLMIFFHRDTPGVIGRVGSIFGAHQVNIAQMSVGRPTQQARRRGRRGAGLGLRAAGRGPGRDRRPAAHHPGVCRQVAARGRNAPMDGRVRTESGKGGGREAEANRRRERSGLPDSLLHPFSGCMPQFPLHAPFHSANPLHFGHLSQNTHQFYHLPLINFTQTTDSVIRANGVSLQIRTPPTDFPTRFHSSLLAVTMIDMPPLDDRVLIALEQNPYLPRRNLRFETSEGRVTLRGIVGSYFQKQMAQEAIRHVAGVDEIANELEVCWR